MLPPQRTERDVEDFKRIYLEALNYGFQAMGKHISKIVADYLLRKYNLTTIETFSNPKALSIALEKSLGYGAILVETRIIKSLRTSVKANPDENDLQLSPTIRLGHPEDFEKNVFECMQMIQKKTVK